jgi:uncharacterized protein
MAVAVVTGASKGIGKAIALRLLKLDYEVIGISRTHDETITKNKNFTPYLCDLSNAKSLEQLTQSLQKRNDISLLCNVAGFGVFKPHEEIDTLTLSRMVAVNLTAPMALSNGVLRILKQNRGTIINITSIEATRASKFSALYSATKAGLRTFSHALFEEVRKSGVNVMSINPDITDTAFFDTLRFAPASDADTRLEAEDIADTIENILSMRTGVCVTDITLRPQRFSLVKKF